MLRAFRPGRNPVAARLTIPERLVDIILFRLNKLSGTIQGLIEKNPLVTREAQEEVFFERRNRAVAIQGDGRASLEVRDLPPLRPGELLIRVRNVAVCATDLEILDGRLGYYKKTDSQAIPSSPVTSSVARYPLSGQMSAVSKRTIRSLWNAFRAAGFARNAPQEIRSAAQNARS